MNVNKPLGIILFLLNEYFTLAVSKATDYFRNGSFTLTETDSGMDSDCDSKRHVYTVLCRTWLHCTDSDSDPYSLILCRTGTRVRARGWECKWAIVLKIPCRIFDKTRAIEPHCQRLLLWGSCCLTTTWLVPLLRILLSVQNNVLIFSLTAKGT